MCHLSFLTLYCLFSTLVSTFSSLKTATNMWTCLTRSVYLMCALSIWTYRSVLYIVCVSILVCIHMYMYVHMCMFCYWHVYMFQCHLLCIVAYGCLQNCRFWQSHDTRLDQWSYLSITKCKLVETSVSKTPTYRWLMNWKVHACMHAWSLSSGWRWASWVIRVA